MALTVKKKTVPDAQWSDFKRSGETLARFLIRPLSDARYQVAVERNQLGLRSDGFDIADIPENAKSWLQRDAEAAAYYLIADWEGLEDEGGNAIAYTPERAAEILMMADVGLELWAWVKAEAARIEEEAENDAAEMVKKPSKDTVG